MNEIKIGDTVQLKGSVSKLKWIVSNVRQETKTKKSFATILRGNGIPIEVFITCIEKCPTPDVLIVSQDGDNTMIIEDGNMVDNSFDIHELIGDYEPVEIKVGDLVQHKIFKTIGRVNKILNDNTAAHVLFADNNDGYFMLENLEKLPEPALANRDSNEAKKINTLEFIKMLEDLLNESTLKISLVGTEVKLKKEIIDHHFGILKALLR